jgi:CRISPR-associated protein Csd1
MSVGDATVVFWAASEDEFENMMADFFSEPPKDDPDRLVEAVKSLYRSAETGVFITDTDKTLFYVLGLSPNAARISIRFWHCGAVAEMAGRFRQYFDELSMTHGPKDKDRLSLWRLLVAVAAQGKSENIPPNLAGDFMRAILEGLPYPQTLLQSVIRRIRAEHEITYPRAALIKATLNRSIRFNNSNQERELTVSLDPENSNIGYRLGCLFATLEKIQQEANPGINATIRDRFYGAASATPSTVFGNLMRLKNHHLSKLENVGRRVNLERQIGQIMDGIVDFPPHLALEDQGRFAIGYYHQMQDFFTKKSDKSE